MQKNTIISIIISIALIGGALYFVSYEPASSVGEGAQAQNIEIRDGVQYVVITAKGGYSPRVTQIKGGLPTKLVMRTSDTYDCSLSLMVRSVGFRKILQSTGEEIIDLGIPKSGDKIWGVCGMGMYNFQIRTS